MIAIAAASKAAGLLAIGADRVIGREADLVANLGRESVQVVIDVVGGKSFAASLEVLVRGGRYAVAGAIGGPIVELDLRTLYLKDLRLLGCTVTLPRTFTNLVRYIENREIAALVSATYALDDIAVAQADFLRKAHTGKIVLIP